jgi:hypothetical protein
LLLAFLFCRPWGLIWRSLNSRPILRRVAYSFCLRLLLNSGRGGLLLGANCPGLIPNLYSLLLHGLTRHTLSLGLSSLLLSASCLGLITNCFGLIASLFSLLLLKLTRLFTLSLFKLTCLTLSFFIASRSF